MGFNFDSRHDRRALPSDEPEEWEDPSERVGVFDDQADLIPVIRAADYYFDGASSGPIVTVLADSVDVGALRHGAMVVVVHRRVGMSATAGFYVGLLNAYVDPLESGPTLLGSAVATSQFITRSLPTTAPFCDVVDMVAPGPQLRAYIVFQKGFELPAAPQQVTLSVYIAMRSGL